jgi:hypothetical protein
MLYRAKSTLNDPGTGHGVKITDKVVEAAARNFESGEEVMMLLLDRRGDDVSITDKMVGHIAQSFDYKVTELLLDTRGDEVKITVARCSRSVGSHDREMSGLGGLNKSSCSVVISPPCNRSLSMSQTARPHLRNCTYLASRPPRKRACPSSDVILSLNTVFTV